MQNLLGYASQEPPLEPRVPMSSHGDQNIGLHSRKLDDLVGRVSRLHRASYIGGARKRSGDFLQVLTTLLGSERFKLSWIMDMQ
jgi:hypothetical protein